MSTSLKPADGVEFRELWRFWQRVVARYAGVRGKAVVSPEGYQKLHAALLAACRSQADQAEPARRTRFQELEQLVHPWITLDALAGTRKPILRDLLLRCQALEGRPRRPRAWGGWRGMLVALLAIVGVAALAALVAAVCSADSVGGGLTYASRNLATWSYRVRKLIADADLSVKVGALTVVLVGFGLRMLFFMRKY